MFENLIHYQQLEGKILQLKRELEKNEAKQTFNKVAVMFKDAENKALEQEQKALKTLKEFEKNQAEYNLVVMELSNLVKLNLEELSESEVNKQIEKANKLNTTLTNLERSLSAQAEAVNSILKDFETNKNNYKNYRIKLAELKVAVNNLIQSVTPEIKALEQEMAKCEKQIDANLLNKYKHLRQDKIFPAFVPLNNNACGGCSMQLPAALLNKLKDNHYLECEQCRRYIYTE